MVGQFVGAVDGGECIAQPVVALICLWMEAHSPPPPPPPLLLVGSMSSKFHRKVLGFGLFVHVMVALA